jgi:hypothetical protein
LREVHVLTAIGIPEPGLLLTSATPPAAMVTVRGTTPGQYSHQAQFTRQLQFRPARDALTMRCSNVAGVWMIDHACQRDQVSLVNARLQLRPRQWFGWQMLPGYGSVPYFSPIWVEEVTPRKTGRRIITVRFIKVLYAEGVENFSLDLRILKHETDYLVSEIIYPDQPVQDRTAIISRIEFDWIKRFCPELWAARPPSSLRPAEQENASHYLSALFPTP